MQLDLRLCIFLELKVKKDHEKKKEYTYKYEIYIIENYISFNLYDFFVFFKNISKIYSFRFNLLTHIEVSRLNFKYSYAYYELLGTIK